MINWAKRAGLENGIVVVIKTSANLKGGKLPKCHLMCERGGKYKLPRYFVDGQSFKRNTGTKKCECPFELRGVPIPPEGVMWHLRVVCGFHNHQLAESMYGHEYPSRLKPMELQFVLDMANSTAPREVLNILKQRDPSNTTGIKTIYNAIFTNKSAKRAGLNQVQYVLEQLIKKNYLHDYRTNPDTNEITDIIWVHPKSLLLFVNCPSVLIIDATYKTNEYRSPLLEVVGITSTMRTYSLMFAYLSNEREEQLTWSLGTLKKWMLEKGTLLPSVFVSDRDMALINAIEICFPTARHILCIWHINQCVMKKCRPMLGLKWNKFNASWHSLINSSTQWSYHHKWKVMREEYRRFQGALNYLWETWLHSYKERFVSAWIDTCMHLGSNSSQRAEGAHARLKMYLGDTMSSLETSFIKIHKMLTNQFGEIQKSFERSLNIPRHTHLHDNIFYQVRCRISLQAMEFINAELKCAEEASHQLAGKCNCSIKTIYGLPCKHDLAHYRFLSIPIPIQSINAHWRRLSMNGHEYHDDGARANRTSKVVEILDGMDPQMREQMIDRFFNIADPSQSTVRAPSYNTEHRGRPTGKDEQSKRRIPSFVDISTSSSRATQTNATSRKRGRGRGSGVRNTLSTHDHPPRFTLP
ncbi:protein FAR-RED IMPAIRED RESPONSE 1-like [Impatiens glandulifera]|uniref:protein FAR-RED IMPAIRED RESPONSE 1-like n=1 Tax=Impatiens glandulifera TaxID=253017 RepID=UPI001FB09228|nr:protein FAR-RED IMPAIRED RESPONSE 1-like [Impatiens glandulifera]